MSAQRRSQITNGCLLLFAVSGWLFAFSKRESQSEGARVAHSSQTTQSGRTFASGGGRNLASAVTALPDEKMAEIVDRLAEIREAQVPGQVNEKLIAATEEVLEDNNFRRRTTNFGLLLALMGPEDAPLVHEMFVKHHANGKTMSEYEPFSIRWGEVGGESALDFLKTNPTGPLSRADFRNIAVGWGSADPQAALAWMDSNAGIAEGMHGRSAIIAGWIRDEPGEAMAWLAENFETLPTHEGYEMTKSAVFETFHNSAGGLDGVLDFIDGFEGDQNLAAHGWRANTWVTDRFSEEDAAKSWNVISKQDWANFRDFQHLYQVSQNGMNPENSPEAFMNSLASKWPSEQVTSHFEEWSREDAATTAEFLLNAPEGPVRQSMIRGLVSALKSTDPEAAAAWAAKLEEG